MSSETGGRNLPGHAGEIEIPPIELAAIARGEGGFVLRGEGEPASRQAAGAPREALGFGDAPCDSRALKAVRAQACSYDLRNSALSIPA